MFVNTRYRSKETEIMDDFSLQGDMLRQTLDQIARINKRLGGNKATLGGLDTILQTIPTSNVIRIADLGCGSGDMLRAIADYGRKNKYRLALTGIDNNDFTVNYARKCSAGYPEIRYVKMDVLSEAFREQEFDITVATLFLHHFDDEQIGRLLNDLVTRNRIGLVINDLHRSNMAYYLFRFISLFIRNPMVRNDGAISVLRGFKKKELEAFHNALTNTTSTIRWKWVFRYQWIIRKYERTN